MNVRHLPRMTLLHESNLKEDSVHSLLISLLRGLAAVQVAAAHLRNEFFPSARSLDDAPLWYEVLAFFTGFAHQAVVVFFLISGWLVGGSLWNKFGQPRALALYAIDRCTRLWTVLLPTFAFMLVAAAATGKLELGSEQLSAGQPYSLPVLLGNLVGLQTIYVPQFGGNYPLWSLANETWYYVLFPLVLVCLRGQGWLARACAAAGIALIATALPAAMILYFAIWLLGAGCSRLRIEAGSAWKALIVVAMTVVAVYFRITGQNDDQTTGSFLQDLLISLPVLLLLSTSMTALPVQRRGMRQLRRVAVVLSNFSFTLYVVHVPLFGVAKAAGVAWFGTARIDPASAIAPAAYVLILACVLTAAYGFYWLFEAHTGAIRRWVKLRLLQQRGATSAAG
ncbi:MAG: acyltransferase family protein [Gammaproteobacteria bacterium]